MIEVRRDENGNIIAVCEWLLFDKKTQGDLVNRFYGSLEKGGFLFIGHSESLAGISHPFRYIRPAVYKK